MKILNLYAGIGGNRKLWGDEHEITAVEYKPEIAKIYQGFFPKDKVIVGDAHQYLLDHYAEFDFIWSSPPCPTHSKARFAIAKGTDFNKYPSKQRPKYPNMSLYEEIIFLKHYFKGQWVIENVIPYYDPLIPAQNIGGHLFWSNFLIVPLDTEDRGHADPIEVLSNRKGFDLETLNGLDKRLVLRNCVEPEIGKHIFECLLNPINTISML